MSLSIEKRKMIAEIERSSTLRAIHANEVAKARAYAVSTGHKGVLLASDGRIHITSSVGFRQVVTKPGHLEAWMEAANDCTLGHIWPPKLNWQSVCQICGLQYWEWSDNK